MLGSPRTSPPTSSDRVERENVKIITGQGRLDGPERVVVTDRRRRRDSGRRRDLDGHRRSARELPEAKPDGERILTWTQVYGLGELPERLIVVGSGVTGAEFASAYEALGVDVVLVSSRDRVLPGRGRRRRSGARGRLRPAWHDRACPSPEPKRSPRG